MRGALKQSDKDTLYVRLEKSGFRSGRPVRSTAANVVSKVKAALGQIIRDALNAVPSYKPANLS
jgi:hypothetical protein